jgi:hypothetical protein
MVYANTSLMLVELERMLDAGQEVEPFGSLPFLPDLI